MKNNTAKSDTKQPAVHCLPETPIIHSGTLKGTTQSDIFTFLLEPRGPLTNALGATRNIFDKRHWAYDKLDTGNAMELGLAVRMIELARAIALDNNIDFIISDPNQQPPPESSPSISADSNDEEAMRHRAGRKAKGEGTTKSPGSPSGHRLGQERGLCVVFCY